MTFTLSERQLAKLDRLREVNPEYADRIQPLVENRERRIAERKAAIQARAEARLKSIKSDLSSQQPKKRKTEPAKKTRRPRKS